MIGGNSGMAPQRQLESAAQARTVDANNGGFVGLVKDGQDGLSLPRHLASLGLLLHAQDFMDVRARAKSVCLAGENSNGFYVFVGNQVIEGALELFHHRSRKHVGFSGAIEHENAHLRSLLPENDLLICLCHQSAFFGRAFIPLAMHAPPPAKGRSISNNPNRDICGNHITSWDKIAKMTTAMLAAVITQPTRFL